VVALARSPTVLRVAALLVCACGPGAPGPDAGPFADAAADAAVEAGSGLDAAVDAEVGLDAAADAAAGGDAALDASPEDGGVEPPPECEEADDFAVPDDPDGVVIGAATSDRPGGFVVAWAVVRGIDTLVRARLFDDCGGPVGDEIAVDDSGLAVGAPVAAAIGGTDQIAVAWSQEDGDREGAGVLVRRFGADGAAVGGAVGANEETFDDQLLVSATALPSGFALGWVDHSGDLLVRPDAVLGVFDEDAGAVTGDLVVSPSADGPQDLPRIAATPGGALVTAWAEATSPVARRRDGAGAWLDEQALPFAAEDEVVLATGAAAGEDGFALALTSFGADDEGDVSVVVLPEQDGAPARVAVSETPAARETDALVAARAGGWVMGWTDETERDVDGALDSSGSTVRGAWLAPDGTSGAASFVVPTTTDFDQDVAGLAAGPGGALFVWLDASRAGGDRDGGLRARLIGLAQQPGGKP
jgi:hypothetical protein